jgi:tRNA (adenine57-N1/adenine58-N1)-methyltransferase
MSDEQESLEIEPADEFAPAIPQPAGSSPWFRPRANVAQPGDLVMLISSDNKRFLINLHPGYETHTHLGFFRHDDLIGHPWGSSAYSKQGHAALMLEPSLSDMMKHVRRGTQIIYPKDAAYLIHRLSLRAGSRVIEAGTGSGSLTIALAWAVAPLGMIYTHEIRPEIANLARTNLERVGLLPWVQIYNQSIDDGFRAEAVDAVFLDVREPWHYLDRVRGALRPGGAFASLLPTTNQVEALLNGLDEERFADVHVEELILRPWKPTPDRLRPEDNFVGHTGFLVFARCIDAGEDISKWQAKERQRYDARMRSKAEIEARAAAQAAEPPGKKKAPLPLPG